MEKYCDNKSVGVIVRNEAGGFAMLRRKRFPIAIAPPAGHIDSHGSPEQAAVDEVREEIGVKLAVASLRRTAIYERRVENVCRRIGGGFHTWNVYEAVVTDLNIIPDPDETDGAGWYSEAAVQSHANRTRHFLDGKITDDSWQRNPGLEPVWVDFMSELGVIN